MGMSMGRLLTAAGLLASILIACSDNWADSLDNQPTKRCVPNQTVVCQCGLDKGSQLCRVDQTLTECKCPPTSKAKAGETDTRPRPGNDDGDEIREPLPTARCGDGTVDPGEACDDGNTDDADGCSAHCVPDGSPLTGETCPGQEVVVWQGTPLAFNGSMDGYEQDDHSSQCDESARGPDRVYAVKPKADGVLKVRTTLAPGFDSVVSFHRRACGREFICDKNQGMPFEEPIPVRKDESVFIVIIDSGRSTASGAYTLELDLEADPQ